MEKKYNSMEYNNATKCEVCGSLTFMDDYGNTDKCPNCGWMQSSDDELMEKWHGISYPMLVPLSRAREQYKAGQKFKATFDDFINGLRFYSEMLFWYDKLCYAVCYGKNKTVIFSCRNKLIQEFATDIEFRDKANINGQLLKDIWDEVVHPCFMYCGGEHDYDFPPED